MLDESCPSSERHVTHGTTERMRLHQDRHTHTHTHTHTLPSSLLAEAESRGVSERLPAVAHGTTERARLHQDTRTHTHTHTHTLPTSLCGEADARGVSERVAGCSKAQAVKARDDGQEVYGVEMGSRGARQIVVRASRHDHALLRDTPSPQNTALPNAAHPFGEPHMYDDAYVADSRTPVAHAAPLDKPHYEMQHTSPSSAPTTTNLSFESPYPQVRAGRGLVFMCVCV